MQRKNNLLKSTFYKKKRRAMAMIMALVVIVTMATIMALSLSLSTATSDKTVNIYLKEQAILLSQSAAEYALLRIAQDGPCSHTNDLNFQPNSDLSYFDVNISIQYIYTDLSGCSSGYFEISNEDQNGSILMDITVSTDVSNEPIRYFRRSIQKL